MNILKKIVRVLLEWSGAEQYAEPPAPPIQPAMASVAESVNAPLAVGPPDEQPANQQPPVAIEPVVEQEAQEIVVRVPLRPLQDVLKDIEKFASWDQKPATKQQLSAVLDECRADHPGEEAAIQLCIMRGEEANRLLEPFYKIGTKHGSKSQEAKKALDELRQKNRGDLIGRAKESMERGEVAHINWQKGNERKKNGQSASSVQPRPFTAATAHVPQAHPHKQAMPAANTVGLHPNDIRNLPPSPSWTLLIDESGTDFDAELEARNVSASQQGRLAGLLLPDRHPLKPLPAWHAVKKTNAEKDAVVQDILNAPVGVIGIQARQLPSAPVERWCFGVLRLIDLVLRLLPLAGHTKLTVLVENRQEFVSGMEWPAIAYDAMLRLAQAYPLRAKQIECHISVIGKNNSPFNGYVDMLAFAWAGASDYSRDCLKQTGLEGTCLLTGDAETVARAWEWLDRGVTLEGLDWAALLAQPDAGKPGSLAGTVLARLGEASRADVAVWQRYLNFTLGYLQSKAIDLKALGRQVEWLEQWPPPGQALPAPLRLLWLTARLARANHHGQTEQPWIDELHTLGDGLLDENAHLVCRAELNLAVNATNCYEFGLAAKTLDRWASLPPSVPGLRYWGQVQSSRGQHAAFLGDPCKAVAHFDAALDAFRRLSDPAQARKEAEQTWVYRAIALLDSDATDTVVCTALEQAIGPVAEATPKLAVSAEDCDKYRHHLLLRWLCYRGGNDGQAAYCAMRGQWQTGTGFPWPLIQLYRGVLLHADDPAAARAKALDGHTLANAPEQGPTVRLIGACCRAIAAGWGEDWQDAEIALAALERDLPAAKPYLQHLHQYMADPVGDPLEMLKAVLPFNFH